ncbi:MAG: hypothetical protein SCALA702_16860 [Melioribacteraceae bacterium]|nr:MAG: hypothetical protein SCALA702_16860 [Melioribacteraceae bacterium]
MKKTLILLFTLLLFSNFLVAQQQIAKTNIDDNSKYTNVGNIGITITNFGSYGHGFSLWPEQPSAEFPIGSGIEHIFDGGLWIGGFIKDAPNSSPLGPYVTTAAVDAASVSVRGGGFEYTNKTESVVTEKSSLLESRFFSPTAVSHQDLIAVFSDTATSYDNGEPIIDHRPLGVEIRQETYAWNYPFADFFVIMNYWVKNVSNKYLDSLYIGLWTDTVVRNTNLTSPRTGSSFFNKGGNGYNDSLKLGYEFDATGDVGFTDSYIGVQFLGANVDYDTSAFVSWQFRNTDDIRYFTPQNDVQRYKKMQGYFSENEKLSPSILYDIKQASNRSILVSAGDFGLIAPGDSINISFAIVGAKKAGFDPPNLDTEAQKENLYNNAGWALRAYNGEDRNGDGILDPDEDLDGDGKITRFILPSPPRSPNVKVVPESNKATIYWDRVAESSIDPISGKKDFEGYVLYRTNSGFDLTEAQDLTKSLVKVAEFDSMGNNVGLNTGFAAVELDAPVTFANDPTEYYYKFEVDNLLNGWQYVFTVTAFDEGDEDNNLESLESSFLSNANRIIPGTPANNNLNDVKVGVYPNPYYGEAYWDGSSERLRKLYFYNLPSECEITIYTLSGDVVKRIEHSGSSNGSDLRWFQTFAKEGNQLMAGGEHAWDLITDSDQAIATGLYLFTVKDHNSGDIQRGKFLIVK